MKVEPRILCVDLVGDHGHAGIDRAFLAALSPLGTPTLLAPPSYLEHFQDLALDRLALPMGLDPRGPGKVLHRFNQILRWRALRRIIDGQKFQAVVVFNYEVTTAWLLAPRDRDIWSFEHNGIDKARSSRLKTWCLKRLPSGWGHLVFLPHMGGFLHSHLGRQSAEIPHPLMPDIGTNQPPAGFPGDRKVLFAPSGSNDPRQISALADLMSKRTDFVLATKGDPAASTEHCLLQKRFDDYRAWVRHAHAVFFAGNFQYRVSGVIYDALSLSTPVIVTDCLLGRAMQQQYPHAVRVVTDLSEVFDLEFDAEGVREDCARLRAAHSPEAITRAFARALELPLPAAPADR